jgi:pimeloyl-ACP methyl ester carboxylesterase
MAIFLICHGAWSAGWAWKKVRPLLRGAGHEVFTPTYTGLGERAHHASPQVDLETHIADVLGTIEFEALDGIALVGHSYGGMVATGVADRVPERIRELIYLDAFVPANGQSLLDLLPPGPRPAPARDGVAEWLIPPNPTPPDTSEADLVWIMPRRRPQPVKTFSQPLHLRNAASDVPRSYIYCTRKTGDDPFLQFSKRFKADPAWRYHEIDASHSPNVTAPEALVRLLCEIAGQRAQPAAAHAIDAADGSRA